MNANTRSYALFHGPLFDSSSCSASSSLPKDQRPCLPVSRLLLSKDHQIKLTWLALGDDHEGLSSRVEQLTALLRSVKP